MQNAFLIFGSDNRLQRGVARLTKCRYLARHRLRRERVQMIDVFLGRFGRVPHLIQSGTRDSRHGYDRTYAARRSCDLCARCQSSESRC
jgi:hypothetical protein